MMSIVETTKEPVKKSTSGSASDLPYAAAIWIWGLIISYIPKYFGIPSPWSSFFQVSAFIFYAVGFLGAVVGLSRLSKTKVGEQASFTLGFMLVAGILHIWSSSVGTEFWKDAIRIIVVLAVVISVGFGAQLGTEMVASRGKPSARPDNDDSQLLQDVPEYDVKQTTAGGRVLTILIATLTFLTAAAQAIGAWRNVW